MYIFANNKANLQSLPCLEVLIDQDTTIYVHRLCADKNLNIAKEQSPQVFEIEKQRIKEMLGLSDDDFVDFEDIFKANIETNEFDKYLAGGSYRGFVVGVSLSFLNSFVPYTKFPEMDSRFENGARKKWKEFLVNGQNQQGKNFIELVEMSKNSCNLQDFKVLYDYMTSLDVVVLTLEEALI